jgi:hypothetical protein
MGIGPTQPGDVRVLSSEKSIVLGLSVSAEKDGDFIVIHLTGDGELFSDTTVNNNPGSARYHRTLFRNLRRVLIANGKWPYGREAAETEEERRVG